MHGVKPPRGKLQAVVQAHHELVRGYSIGTQTQIHTDHVLIYPETLVSAKCEEIASVDGEETKTCVRGVRVTCGTWTFAENPAA